MSISRSSFKYHKEINSHFYQLSVDTDIIKIIDNISYEYQGL